MGRAGAASLWVSGGMKRNEMTASQLAGSSGGRR